MRMKINVHFESNRIYILMELSYFQGWECKLVNPLRMTRAIWW